MYAFLGDATADRTAASGALLLPSGQLQIDQGGFLLTDIFPLAALDGLEPDTDAGYADFQAVHAELTNGARKQLIETVPELTALWTSQMAAGTYLGQDLAYLSSLLGVALVPGPPIDVGSVIAILTTTVPDAVADQDQVVGLWADLDPTMRARYIAAVERYAPLLVANVNITQGFTTGDYAGAVTELNTLLANEGAAPVSAAALAAGGAIPIGVALQTLPADQLAAVGLSPAEVAALPPSELQGLGITTDDVAAYLARTGYVPPSTAITTTTTSPLPVASTDPVTGQVILTMPSGDVVQQGDANAASASGLLGKLTTPELIIGGVVLLLLGSFAVQPTRSR